MTEKMTKSGLVTCGEIAQMVKQQTVEWEVLGTNSSGG